MPAPMQSAGRMNRPKKARILPVAPAVNEGRTRNTAASAIVRTTNAMRTPVSPNTNPPCEALAEISSGTPTSVPPNPYFLAGRGKSIYFVILSEAKNLSSIVSTRKQKEERFFASLRMTKLLVFPQSATAWLAYADGEFLDLGLVPSMALSTVHFFPALSGMGNSED